MILYVDTALTGRYVYREADDSAVQPHLVRLAMLLVEPATGREVETFCQLIMPREGWSYDPEAVVAHQIHPVMALERGIPLERAFETFKLLHAEAELLVGFNWDHQRRVLLRTARDCGDAEFDLPKLGQRGSLCDMRQSAGIIRKPRREPGGGNAWPKLSEAIEYFSDEPRPRLTDPVEQGLALVRAIQRIHEGIVRGGR